MDFMSEGFDAEALLGHAVDVSPRNGNTSHGGAKERARRKSSAKPNFAPPNSRISVEHDRFLDIYRASEDGEGSLGKQITLVTEKLEVALGKKPEPGTRAPEVQKMKKLSLRLQSSDSQCKQDDTGRCIPKPTDRRAVTSLSDPALRVFCCPKCGKLIEYEIEAIPHLELASVVSIWDDFTIHVHFEQQPEVSSVIAVKALPDFVNILHSFAGLEVQPIAVSEDMRLLARIKTGGRDLGPDFGPEAGPKIEVSIVEKNISLHGIELSVGTFVRALNFSHDGTLLLASMQSQSGVPTLVVWSMITGKEMRKIRANTGSTLLASFSSKADRVFIVELCRGGEKSARMVKLEVLFLKTSPDLSENFRTLNETIAEIEGVRAYDKSNSSKWDSGNGEVIVHSTGGYEVKNQGPISPEQGNILYNFAAHGPQDEAGRRQNALALDHKRSSNSGKTNKEYLDLLTMLRTMDKTVIRKASISQNGEVFAHVFDSEPDLGSQKTKVYLPSNKTALVWNLKTGELCHRFEHERSVTCVQVSTDGTILMVGISGLVSADHRPGDRTRLEQSAIKVYSLITRELLWEVPLMHEVAETYLHEKQLLFKIDNNADSSAESNGPPVFAIPTSEHSKFPCLGPSDDSLVVELQLLHEIGDNLSVVTADELLAGLESTTLMSYRSGPSTEMEGTRRMRQGSLLPDSYLKPASSQESWRSAAVVKRLVGLCVSGDGLSYVAKWAGEGDGGRAIWLSVGDVDWGRGVMVHRENIQLLEAGFEEVASPEKIGAFCISNDGNIVACCIEGTCRVVVIWVPAHDDTAQEKILWEFDADVVPKALGVDGERLSLMGDRELQASFLVKENIVLSYSLVTRVLLSKVQHKSGGKTLAINGTGELRVSMSQEHRIFLERFTSGQVLYEIFDHNMQFMGISGSGNRLILKDTGQHGNHALVGECRCGEKPTVSGLAAMKRRGSTGARERAGHSMVQIDIPNFELFGPSRETCATWMASGSMAQMVEVHKARLARWLLFDQVVYEVEKKKATTQKKSFISCLLAMCSKPKSEKKTLKAQPGRWSRTVSKLVREKDYDSINLILEACPVMWACLIYTTLERDPLDLPLERTSSRGNSFRSRGDSSRGKASPMGERSSTQDQSAANLVDRGHQQQFLLHALNNNDRLLVQLLLDGVRTIVERDKGAQCPVNQMSHVTEFIMQCLKQRRMLDIVERFLKELPLIKVDETDERKHVRSHFRRGRVISTGWTSRDAEAITGPWGHKPPDHTPQQDVSHDLAISADEEPQVPVVSSKKNFERGYQYVVAIPGLCDQEFLELILSYQASPGLLDNESMRAATRVLEGDLQTRVLGIPMSGHFVAFLFCLACFCGFVELCVVPVQDDGFSKYSRDEIWDMDWGKAGVILGGVSTLFNLIFLVQELEEMANSRPIWTYFKPWNVIPWLSNLMAITNFVEFCLDASNVAIRATGGIAMILLWGTLFTFLRSVRKLSALVNMLIQIMNDMLMFILVVLVLLISFAGGLYCLHGHIVPEEERAGYIEATRRSMEDVNWQRRAGEGGGGDSDGSDSTDPNGPSSNVFLGASDSIGRAFVMSVLLAFEVDELRSPLESGGGGALTNLSYLFFFGLVMLVSVVGMNALIAIMNNSFTRVAEREHAVRDKEVASVMLDKLRNFNKKKKYRWQKQRRWVHVLSPSEKGSLILGGGSSVTEQIKREINASEARSEVRINHILDVIKEYEEVNTENANMMRELDNAARIGLQETGSKQSKLIGMFKKLSEDQGKVHGEVKVLTTSVKGLTQRVERDQARAAAAQHPGLPVNLQALEQLPWQFKQMQQNQEVLITQMANVQRELGKMMQQMQSFEWQITGVEQTARTTSAILAPLATATVEREDRVMRSEDSRREDSRR